MSQAVREHDDSPEVAALRKMFRGGVLTDEERALLARVSLKPSGSSEPLTEEQNRSVVVRARPRGRMKVRWWPRAALALLNLSPAVAVQIDRAGSVQSSSPLLSSGAIARVHRQAPPLPRPHHRSPVCPRRCLRPYHLPAGPPRGIPDRPLSNPRVERCLMPRASAGTVRRNSTRVGARCSDRRRRRESGR